VESGYPSDPGTPYVPTCRWIAAGRVDCDAALSLYDGLIMLAQTSETTMATCGAATVRSLSLKGAWTEADSCILSRTLFVGTEPCLLLRMSMDATKQAMPISLLHAA